MALTIQKSYAKRASFFAVITTAIFAIALQPIMASGLVGAVVINELMPNPVELGDATTEWVELKNPSAEEQTISGWTVAGATLPSPATLSAGELFVLCKTDDATAQCDAVDGSLQLTNTGSQIIQLRDDAGELVDEFTYNGSNQGESIEVVRENGTVSGEDNATDAYDTNQTPPASGNTGTPGAVNRAQPLATEVTNTRTGMVYSVLQLAVNDADVGDTIRLNEDITISQQVTVNKQLTIDGGGHKITANFVKTDYSNNAAIGVYADGVAVSNIVLDGVDPVQNKLHGINLYKVVGVNISNATINNFQAGIEVNGSKVDVSGLATLGNSWAAIELGQGEGVTDPVELTISGPVEHAETISFGYVGFVANIWVEDNTQPITVNDPSGLYVKDTYGASDVYIIDPGPDPTDSHQLSLSGTIYRDRAVDDCDNRSECLAQPADNKLEGWEARLYKENDGSDWVYVKSAMTNQDGNYNIGSQKEAGTYHVCEVVPAGWTQVKQTWSGSGYKVDTPNQSGATDEGPYCTTTNYDDTRDRSSKSRIGNIDSKKPFTEIVSPLPDGRAYGADFTVAAKTTDNESGIVQAVINLYDQNGFKAPCTNESVLAQLVHEYSCDVDVDGLAEGDYYLKVNSKDAQGNTSNTISWTFSVDKTAPGAPTITQPGARQWFKSAPIVNKWTSVTDASGTDYYQIAYNYDDGHSFGGSTCPGVSMVGYVGFIGCRDVNSTQRNHQPGKSEEGGVTIWVRAVDNAGNVGPWSKPVNYHYDHTAPTTTIVAPVGIVDGTFTVNGVAGDNLQLNRIYVQLVNRDDGKRYGGTTVHLISNGTSSDWKRDYNSVADNLPDGTYAAHVSVVDMAGNSSTAGWTDNFVVDGTKPSAKVVTPANGDLLGASFTVSGTASDNETSIDRVEYKVTEIDAIGGSYVANVTSGTVTGTDNWTFDMVGLDTGFYRLKVQAFDAAGNWKYHYNDIEVDADAPVIVITEPGKDTLFTPGTVQVAGTLDDQTAGPVSVTLGSVTIDVPVATDGTWVAEFTDVIAGAYTVSAAATDAVGNQGSIDIDNVTVNTVPPAITNQNANDDDTNVQGATTNTPSTVLPLTTALQQTVLPFANTLGVTQTQTETSDATNDDEPDAGDGLISVAGATDLGASTTSDPIDELEDEGCLSFFGLCWYWWIAIGIGTGVVVYAIGAATRRSDDEN